MQVTCLWHKDTMISVSLSGAINFLDMENPDTPKAILHGCKSAIKSLYVDRDAGLFYTGEISGRLTCWDMKTNLGKWFSGKAIESQVAAMNISGDVLEVYTFDGKLRAHDAKTITLVQDKDKAPTDIGGHPVAVAQSRGDATVTAVLLAQQKIVLFKGGVMTGQLAIDFDGLDIAWGHDDTKLYVADKRGCARVFDVDVAADSITATGVSYETNGQCRFVCLSSDGKYLATLDQTRSIFFFDLESGNKLNNLDAFQAHTSTLRGGTWSPDGSKLATFSADCRIIVWYEGGWEGKHLSIDAHDQAVTHVEWIDEETILSVAEDRTIRIWTIPTETS